MKKRDLIKEIVSVKDRAEFYGRTELQSRIFEIDYALNEHLNYKGEFNNEILKYIPIATVACFESFFRTIVSELIEVGEPYTENVLKFNQTKSIKFDFNIVNEIQKKTITIGDFVAHYLSCNNLDDFNSNLSTLTQTDFLSEVKNYKPKSIREQVTFNSENLRSNFPRILESIKKTFELRHIFCHEFATKVKIEYDEIKLIYEDCKIFLNQVNEYIWYLIDPDAPMTQTDMNIQAGEDFQKSESELNEIIEKIKKADFSEGFSTYDIKKFDLVIEKWKEYRNAKADLEAESFSGGTMEPLIRLSTLSNLTQKMTAELKEDYELKK